MLSMPLVLALFACKGQVESEDKAVLQSQIDDLMTRMEVMEAQFAVRTAELQTTAGELSKTQDDLAATQADLDATRAELAEAIDRLEERDIGFDVAISDLRTDIAAISGGITFTELADQLDDHEARLLSVEGSYAATSYVDAADAAITAEHAATTAAQLVVDTDQSARLATLEGAGLATESWVLMQSYATSSTVTANNDAIADATDRIADLEATDFATETWVGSQGYASESWVTGQGYATQASLDITNAEVGTVSGRLQTLENAGYTTRDWIEMQGFLAGDDYTDLDGRITALVDADVVLSDRVSTLEGAGYATVGEVDAVSARVATLESTDLATETWVTAQGFATMAEVTANGDAIAAVDARLATLESTDLATETWVGTQGFATETWVNGQGFAPQSAVDSTDAAVSAIDTRLRSVENAGYTTLDWITNQGFLDASDYDDLDGRVSTLEGAGYATSADVTLVSDRVTALEDADFATAEDVATDVADIEGRLDAIEDDYATDADVAGLDSRLSTVEGSYATDADVAVVAGRVLNVEANLASVDGRVSAIESSYATSAALTAVDARVSDLENAGYATDADLVAIGDRVSTIEGSYATDADVTAIGSRVSAIESSYATNADVAGVSSRLATVEDDYLTSTDLAGATSQLDADIAGLTTRVTQVENTYATDADVAVVSGRVLNVEANLTSVGNRVTVLENAGYATDADVTAVAARLTAVEDDYLTSTDLSGVTTRLDAIDTDVAGVAGRLTTVENTYATGAALAGVDDRVSDIEADYLTSGDYSSVTSRLDVIESSYATDADVAVVAGRLLTVENTYATDAELGAVRTRVTSLENADNASSAEVDAIAARLSAIEGGGYATTTYVDVGDNALDDRITVLEDADYAAGIDAVSDRVTTLETLPGRVTNLTGRVTANEVQIGSNQVAIIAHDSRLSTLENAGFVDDAWVLAQNYADTNDVADLQDQIDAIDFVDDGELSAAINGVQSDVDGIDARVSSIEGNYATRGWVNSRGFLTTVEDPWTIGNGLRVVNDTLEVDLGAGLEFAAGALSIDETEIEGLAQDVCYDRPAELLAALDGEYLPADTELEGVLLGDTNSTCNSAADLGLIRYRNGAFQACTPTGWTTFADVQDGATYETAGESCAQIKGDFPASVDGVYWLAGLSGGVFEAYCDMTTDGGGWTLVGTMSGGDANNWNTQYGYWSNDSTLGHAEDPWTDHKSQAWMDLDVSDSEVLFQRRYANTTRGQAKLSNDCLFGVTRFRDLFTSYDTSLRCEPSDITVLMGNATGVTSPDFREGATSGLGGSGTNGFCWNGGDTHSDTFMGHAGWNPASQSCLSGAHLGYIGVWQSGVAFNNLDVDNTEWLSGVDTSYVEISFFVR